MSNKRRNFLLLFLSILVIVPSVVGCGDDPDLPDEVPVPVYATEEGN